MLTLPPNRYLFSRPDKATHFWLSCFSQSMCFLYRPIQSRQTSITWQIRTKPVPYYINHVIAKLTSQHTGCTENGIFTLSNEIYTLVFTCFMFTGCSVLQRILSVDWLEMENTSKNTCCCSSPALWKLHVSMSVMSVGVPSPVGGSVWRGPMWCPSQKKWNFPFEMASFGTFWASWCGDCFEFWLYIYTVTNRIYYWNCLTCTAIWNFPVKCRLPQQISRRPLWNW